MAGLKRLAEEERRIHARRTSPYGAGPTYVPRPKNRPSFDGNTNEEPFLWQADATITKEIQRNKRIS